MRKVRLYILKNLDRPLPSLKEIGLIHQTNKTNLKVQFKKLYGTTIYQFYNQKRLEKAGLLIRNTELPISAVIQQCGFKDPSHFARKFKAQFGHSPRIYRGVASS
jgi:AraC-like DNA-binding protein